MEQVKADFFKKTDSLESVKRTDTSAVKQYEIAGELVSADSVKNVKLMQLQKEFNSSEELKK